MDMHLIFPFFRGALDGPSIGAAFVLAVVQYMTGCKLIPRVRSVAAPLSFFYWPQALRIISNSCVTDWLAA